ncbi:uncharacterized protein KY384_000836 [Bacidia gigantensis]|uniref:uncharacterized protein n=1 Tax=Bacidia gigantensis TaxID=2732470 RepID=UPI001D05BE40|nr:uncharacterized protein KY384_000836 [Bacidia gigantensis]KAG8533994.1 hypothetical protein KY384_000836 [Bacidia gigantensis]
MTTSDVREIRRPAHVAMLTISLALVPAFAFWVGRQERLGKPALIPNSIWKNKAFTSICLMVLLAFGVMQTMELFVSLFFQQVQRLSALETSIRLLPAIVMGLVLEVTTGLFVHRISVLYLVVISSLLSAGSPLLMAVINKNWPYWYDAFFAQFLMYFSVDVLFTVGSFVISDVFPPQTQALAGAIFNVMNQFGTSLGLAVMGVIASAVTKQSDIADKASPEALEAGYRATFWAAMAWMLVTCCIGVFGLRKIGKDDTVRHAEMGVEIFCLPLSRHSDISVTQWSPVAQKALHVTFDTAKARENRASKLYLTAQPLRKSPSSPQTLPPPRIPQTTPLTMEYMRALSSNKADLQKKYLTKDSKPYDHITIGAIILSKTNSPDPEPRLLLLKRAVHDKLHPNVFEIPVASMDDTDLDVQEVLKRVVSEKMGLRVGWVVGALKPLVYTTERILAEADGMGGGDEGVAGVGETAKESCIQFTFICESRAGEKEVEVDQTEYDMAVSLDVFEIDDYYIVERTREVLEEAFELLGEGLGA